MLMPCSSQAPEVGAQQGPGANKGRPKSGSKEKKASPLNPEQEEVWCTSLTLPFHAFCCRGFGLPGTEACALILISALQLFRCQAQQQKGHSQKGS